MATVDELKAKLKDILGEVEFQFTNTINGPITFVIQDQIDNLILKDVDLEAGDLEEGKEKLIEVMNPRNNKQPDTIVGMREKLEEVLKNMSDQKKESIKLREYLRNALESIAAFLPQEKRDFTDVLLKELDKIQASDYKINPTGLSHSDNLEKLKEQIKQGIEKTALGDINVELIHDALKAVQMYAISREENVTIYDINKTMMDKLGDFYKTLSRDEQNVVKVAGIIFSPVIAILVAAFYSSILLFNLIEHVERAAIKFGEQTVHHLKDAASAAKFWADTQVDQLLNTIKDKGVLTYHGSNPLEYKIEPHEKQFAEAYKKNPYIIDALKAKMGDNTFLRINSEDGKINENGKSYITRLDCEKFHEKAMSKLDMDRDPFLSLLSKISHIAKGDLWTTLENTADEMKKKAEEKAQTAAPEKPGAEKAGEAGEAAPPMPRTPPPYSEKDPETELKGVQAPNPAKPQSKGPE